VVDLWQGWDGKYVIYTHKSTGVRQFGDLSKVFVLSISDVEMTRITEDFVAFFIAGQLSIKFEVEGDKDAYREALLSGGDRIGFMVPSVAEYCGFPYEQELVRIEFE
jgi:hypothetical protein